MDFDSLLAAAVDAGASDIHLKVGRPPMARCDGSVVPLPYPELTDADLETCVRVLTTGRPEPFARFQETGDLDLAYTSGDLPRFRVNVFRQRGSTSMALRVIPKQISNFEELGLPGGVSSLAEEHRGLILVTGATGSGKTTTLAAMLNYVNRTRASHIVTIEDPIEILHDDEQSIVNQREVGVDTPNFGEALRRALRQDPDTIMIGELRDSETAMTALQAAESGHLVFSTLHTIDAAETVSRMIELFPGAKQQQVRSIMAGVLRGVVSQRLLPRLDGGRIAIVEIMITNARIGDLIREGRADEIPDAIAEGDFFGMQTFQQSLVEKVLDGTIDREVAADAAGNRHDFLVALDRAQLAAGQTVDEPEPEPDADAAEPEPFTDSGLRVAGASHAAL